MKEKQIGFIIVITDKRRPTQNFGISWDTGETAKQEPETALFKDEQAENRYLKEKNTKERIIH